MSANILVTGANGKLGRALRQVFGEASHIFYTDRKTLDVTNEVCVKAFIADNNIQTVINCAAYTAVDKAEDEPALADAINHLGAAYLAKYAKQIIHISTDYVFDGTGRLPYRPEDIPHPQSIYGKTKLAGEQAVLRFAKTAIIIRTAWVYAPWGSNFVKTMQRLGKDRDSIGVVDDQVGTPTYAPDLALVISEILQQINQGEKQIYHFSNDGVCSWYDFAVQIMAESKLSCRVKPIDTKSYPTRAKRPAYSVLDNHALKERLHIVGRPWQEALRACLQEMGKNI